MLGFLRAASVIRLGMVGLAMVIAMPAFAVREPLPVAIDRRVRTMVYTPNEVFRYMGHYGYTSIIEFEVGESIQTISVGDSVAWQITPTENRIFLKPIEQSADTNMMVITDKRMYLFELVAREAEDMRDEEMVFVMRFVYPNVTQGGMVTSVSSDIPLPDLETERDKYNFRYSLSGEDRIAPIRIFDDNRFTYFEFDPRMPDIPAFFMVDQQGKEALVNFRRRANYIIVERVAPRFTLRFGGDTVCVYNERLYSGK